MTTETHAVQPEDVMALLDGELSAADARAISAHIEQCDECGRLADGLRATSQSLARWSVPEAPQAMDGAVSELAGRTASAARSAKPARLVRAGFWNWRLWTIAGGGAVAALFIASAVLLGWINSGPKRMMEYVAPQESPGDALALRANQGSIDGQPIAEQRSRTVSEMIGEPLKGEPKAFNSLVEIAPGVVGGNTGGGFAPATSPPPPLPTSRRAERGGSGGPNRNEASANASTAPMIARTVSLTIQVKDFAASRASLDAIVVRHGGYAAQLTVNTQEGAPRSLNASLRIPAPELAAAIAELRALGRVETEAQSGEEVTQQHSDLVARLKNSREEEERLRAILQERTGKIEDVLEVEEQIAAVREEIERMEAEQAALEHRVTFASVDLRLTEDYKAQLDSPDSSAATRLHNAFVAGLGNAGGTVLGIILFFEEYGPAMLIWAAILGLPAWLAWRRYRRMSAKI
jgi:hypothetical protein